MKKILAITSIIVTASLSGCLKDDAFLDKQPTNLLGEAQLWKDPGLVLSLLGNLYNRYYDLESVEDWASFANNNDAFLLRTALMAACRMLIGVMESGGTWDYGYIRDMNLFIQKCTASRQTGRRRQKQVPGRSPFSPCRLLF